MIDDFQNRNASYKLAPFWVFRLRLSYLDIGKPHMIFVLSSTDDRVGVAFS